MNKQQQAVLNMAGFIKSQSLTLLEKLDALDADEQAAIVRSCTNSQKNSRTASRHALK
ncbi:Rop family plasmid primer RNA-binding protein [Escherichia coli]|uniref:Rop family plasmid primer RNA-binding protein n=1 Tax=Escherichia coli TaxID=562 RepID=UPI00358EC57D